MPIAPTDFWLSGSGTFPPLTDETVRRAEEELGLKLPEALLSLLCIQNGGATCGLAFPTQQATSWGQTHVPLHELFGIVVAKIVLPDNNIMQSAHLTDEWEIPEKQVLLSGDGHWFITLDYRQGPEPTVAWIDTEMQQDIQLASSFTEFFAGLVSDDVFEDDEQENN